MKKVILIKNNLLKNMRKTIRENTNFSKEDKVAVKAHLGEYGNLAHIRPQILNAIVEELKEIGTKPFIFDTPTLYPGQRDTPEKYLETARRNGFTKETMGCPIIISDEGVKVKGKKHLDEVEVAKSIHDADGMIVASHFKGHWDAGFGGCIKNLAMGATNKKMKSIQHTDSQPIMIGECTGCGTCVEVCRHDAVNIENKIASFDYGRCFGCGACIENCPNGVLKPRKTKIRTLLSEAAGVVVGEFDPNKLLFINVLFDITEKCDCSSVGGIDSNPIVCPNIGIIVSKDIVAADKASLDLVRKTVGRKIFQELHHVNPEEQIDSAVELVLGSKEYELEILERDKNFGD